MADAVNSGVKKYGSKLVPMKPAWLKAMHQKREKVLHLRRKQGGGEGESCDDLPVATLYPSAFQTEMPGLPADNYSVLDLDMKVPNLGAVTAHHRFYTWANTEVGYKWDENEGRQSWISPPSGTYLHYIRYRGRMMCLVGDSAQSWFTGILTETVCAEFQHDASATLASGRGKKASHQERQVGYIVPNAGMKKIWLHGKGNYKFAETALLGPESLRNSFDIVWDVLHGLGSGNLQYALDVLVIHLWESARMDLIRERTMTTFSEDRRFESVLLDCVHIRLMRNWGAMSDAAIKSMESLEEFASKEDIPIFCVWDALKTIRILHRPVAEPKGSFHMMDLPIPLKDGGRPLNTAPLYPTWVSKSYTPRKFIKPKILESERTNHEEAETKSLDSQMLDHEEAKTKSSVVAKTKRSEEARAKANSKSSGSLSCIRITKYKDAAKIANDVMKVAVSYCIPGAVTGDICVKTGALISEHTKKIYKNLKRGPAIPTSLTVNNFNCESSSRTTLKKNDLININLGCHIDGFAALASHPHIINGEVTGKGAPAIAAANTAAEVAVRLIRPGKKSKDVTEALHRVAAAYDCKIVESVLIHRLQQFGMDGNYLSLSVSDADEFEENEAYSIDIVASEKSGILMARTKLTMLIKPNGLDRITINPVQEDHSSRSTCDNDEIKAWLALGLKTEKGACRRKKALMRKDHPWYVQAIKGDGKCLFRALAHGEYYRVTNQKMDEEAEIKEADILRAKVVDEMRNRREEVIGFLGEDFDTYVHKMSDPFEWGGQPELIMAAYVLRIHVHVYRRDANGTITLSHGGNSEVDENGINVLYNGVNHYDLLLLTSQTWQHEASAGGVN